MEENKVGDYIRTNKGTIGQIIEKRLGKFFKGKDDDEIPILRNVYELDTKQWTTDEYIVKNSKDIRGLIEKGDYVNGDEVIAIDYNEDENGNAFDVLGVYDIDDDYAYTIELSRIHIRTILTHEMYEQNCYKVGVENE